MNLKRHIPVLALSVLMAQCAGSKFKGTNQTQTDTPPAIIFDETPLDVSTLPENTETKNSGGPTTGTSSLLESPSDLSCEATTAKTINVSPNDGSDIKTQDNARVVMNIKGRFCPTVSDNLTVLFIIDYSGSMGPNKPDNSNMGFTPATGNDPRTVIGTGKTCGRLQAVEAILAKFKDSDKVNIGTVAFAGDILETHTAAPVDPQNFKTSKLAEAGKLNNFCSYVAPDSSFTTQEMAIPNPKVAGTTNYAAAFDRAYEFLKDVKGRKAIYFITDGRPTAGGRDPFEAGKIAAAKLKTLENLFFNAFFLQYKQSGLQEDKQGFDNLVQTIGASERVVRVDSAAQLAIEVGKDQGGSFEPSQIKATLTIDPYQPEADLQLVSFAQDPANPKAWVFETQTFVLLGKGDEVYTHLVKVLAKAKDGTTHSSQVKINYQKALK